MPAQRPHDHKPLWAGGRVFATCNTHMLQVLLNTGKPVKLPRSAR